MEEEHFDGIRPTKIDGEDVYIIGGDIETHIVENEPQEESGIISDIMNEEVEETEKPYVEEPEEIEEPEEELEPHPLDNEPDEELYVGEELTEEDEFFEELKEEVPPQDFNIKDPIQESLRILQEKKAKEKHIHDALEREKKAQKRLRDSRKLEKKRNLRNLILTLLNLNTYIGFIEKVEPFIHTVGMDLIYLCMISSILYLFYIIFTISTGTFALMPLLFKMLGCISVNLLSFLIMRNQGEKVNPPKNEE